MTDREQLIAEVNRLEALRKTANLAEDWDSAQAICLQLCQAYRRLELLKLEKAAQNPVDAPAA